MLLPVAALKHFALGTIVIALALLFFTPNKQKKIRGRRGRGGLKSGPNPIVRDRARLLINFTTAANQYQIFLSTSSTTGLCQFGNKLLNMSDNYSLYRFTKVSIEMSPGGESTTTGRWYCGYSPEVNDTPPANAGGIIELPWSMPILFTGSATNPNGVSNVVKKRIPGQMLTGQLVKWFFTRVGNHSADLCSQGTLYFLTPGTTDSVFVVIDYEIEFKDWVQTSLTPDQIEHIRAMDSHDWKKPHLPLKEEVSDGGDEHVECCIGTALPPLTTAFTDSHFMCCACKKK